MQELRIYMETLWRLEHRLCPAWAGRRKLRQKANTRYTEDGTEDGGGEKWNVEATFV